MENGFSIVVGGINFNPLNFISEVIEPDNIQNSNKDNYLEFNDYTEKKYPLDMVAEAIDILDIYQNYFQSFMHEATVEYRAINFLIDNQSESLDFNLTQIKLLNKLKFTISITIIN